MKYPYIGEAKNGSVVLFYGSETGLSLNDDAGSASFGSLIGQCLESEFFNITAEYLANTYGEVKSKEHAEFIKLLAENAGIDVFPQLLDANHFVIKGKLSFHNCERITSSELKQITIPLPPECDEKIYRHEGMEKKPKHFDCICNKCGGRCCIGNCDEWPKVGSKVTWGNCSYTAEVIAIHNNMAWVFTEGEYHNEIAVSKLQKPKTPEQELREFLHLLWRENNEDFDDFADIAVLHLTKKGEGDE